MSITSLSGLSALAAAAGFEVARVRRIPYPPDAPSRPRAVLVLADDLLRGLGGLPLRLLRGRGVRPVALGGAADQLLCELVRRG